MAWQAVCDQEADGGRLDPLGNAAANRARKTSLVAPWYSRPAGPVTYSARRPGCAGAGDPG
jgi:hypothetical protein